MHSTPQDHPSIAATAHFVDSERLLAALPLVDKRDRDHHLMPALINAVLAIAATVISDGQSQRRVI